MSLLILPVIIPTGAFLLTNPSAVKAIALNLRMTTITTPPSDDNNRFTSPAPESREDGLTNFADAIANNFKLDSENRAELHSFLELGTKLSHPSLELALVQHATALQTQQLIREALSACNSIQVTVKSIEEKAAKTFSPDQMEELRAASKFVLYDHRRINFDNDAIVPAVIEHLKKHQNTNGFKEIFAPSSRAREKALVKLARDQASYAKAVIRTTILSSMPGKTKKHGQVYVRTGTGLTPFVAALAKKCTGASENATTKEAIWCAVLRHIVRENPRLANLTESDEDQEPLRAPKRLRDGTAKQGKAADGNDFFSVLEDCFVQMRREKGDDWKGVEWTIFIDKIITCERSLWPMDGLPLIPQTRGIVPTHPSSAAGPSRSSGLAGVYTPAQSRPRTSETRPQQPSNACGFHSRSSSSSSLAQPERNLLPRPSGTGIDSSHRATGPGTSLPSMSYVVGAVHQTHSRHASNDDGQSVALPPIRDSTNFVG